MQKMNTTIDLGNSFEKLKKVSNELHDHTADLLMGLIDSGAKLKQNEYTPESYAQSYAYLAAKVKVYLIRTTELSSVDLDRLLAKLPNEKTGREVTL